MADIDSLSIRVTADVKRATDSLNRLGGVLTSLSTSLNSVNKNGFSQLSGSLNQFANAAQRLSSIKKTDFNKLTNSINSLGNIDSVKVMQTSSAINGIVNSISGVSSANMTQVAEDMKNLGIGLRGLGYKTTATAIQNLPALTVELERMFNTMATMPAVSRSTIDFTNALANLARTGRSAGTASRSLNNALRSQRSEMDKVKTKTLTLAQTIGKLYAAYFWVSRLTKAMFSFVDSAMDTYEALNYFNVAIDRVASNAMGAWKEMGYESADVYYKSFSTRLSDLLGQMTGYSTDNKTLTLLNSKSLGMNISEFTQASASFIQIADSIGMTGESALNTSKALSMLASDWSSLRNISTQDALAKMESALVGQSRAVRSLGIDITVTSLQEEAYRLGFMKSVTAMTQHEKSLLRVITMLRQSKVAYGDLARTIDSPANQMRMLSAAGKNLARTLGSLVLPVFSTIIPYITGFTIAINRALVALGNFLGVDWSQNITSMSGGSDALADLEDSIDGVTGASDKMNKSTRGWDEINNLTTPKSSGGGVLGDGDTALLDGALALALAEYEQKWNEAFDGMESKAQKVSEALTRLANNPVFQTLAVGAGVFGAMLLGEKVMGAITSLINKLTLLKASASFKAAIEVSVAFAVAFGGFELGKWIGNLIFGEEDRYQGNLFEIISYIFTLTPEEWADLGKGWLDGIGIIWERIKEWFSNTELVAIWNESVEQAKHVLSVIQDGFTKLRDFVINTITNLKTTWQTGWNVISNWWNNTWFVKFFNSLLKKFSISNIKKAFDGIKTGFVNIWNGAIEGVKSLWNKFAEWLNNKLTFQMQPITIMGKTLYEGGTIKLANLPTYSTGGFPEDGLFMANHNELVGQFSNGQTAVANNGQIIEGIRQGVYEAVRSAMGDRDNTTVVQIDGKEVFSAVQKQSRDYKRSTGRPAFT